MKKILILFILFILFNNLYSQNIDNEIEIKLKKINQYDNNFKFQNGIFNYSNISFEYSNFIYNEIIFNDDDLFNYVKINNNQISKDNIKNIKIGKNYLATILNNIYRLYTLELINSIEPNDYNFDFNLINNNIYKNNNILIEIKDSYAIFNISNLKINKAYLISLSPYGIHKQILEIKNNNIIIDNINFCNLHNQALFINDKLYQLSAIDRIVGIKIIQNNL